VNNGTVPMGGVIARQSIYDAFMQVPSTRWNFHGHTYSAHLLAVAAAHATLDILHEDDAETLCHAGRRIEAAHAARRTECHRYPQLAPLRRSIRHFRARSACVV
jgi:adenosylmethionine-8-amino-7-oxononanoate aminotransferase